MATIQQILDDINLGYRNTFQTSQILVYERRTKGTIRDTGTRLGSLFVSNGGRKLLVSLGVEKDRIKVMTIQTNDSTTNPNFIEFPWIEIDNRQFAYQGNYWFTILENNFYINFPSTPVGNRLIYLLRPAAGGYVIDYLSVEPSVPVRYQVLLKLGVLKRIAESRKDTLMRNNYDEIIKKKISNIQEKMALQVPEYHTPVDTLPRRGRFRVVRYS